METKEKETAESRKTKILDLLKKRETKGKPVNTLIETGKDLVIGGVLGAGAGAAIGKPSLLVGIATTAVGHYFGIPVVQSFGMGMMTAGSYQVGSELLGQEKELEGLEGAKERVKAFGKNLLERLYVDKFLKGKTTPKPPETKKDETIGEQEAIQFFKDTDKHLDMGALDTIEQELTNSANQYARQQVNGTNDDFTTIEERIF